jgi:hypothetical protein
MKAHQLYKQIDSMLAQVAIDSPGNLVAAVTGDDWEYIPLTASGTTYQAFVNRQYIDLAGWSKQDLTMFTVGVDIQKDGTPLATSIPCPLITVYDFLTTRRLSTAQITAIGAGSTPSFAPSTLDLMQCIYGERQSLAQNAQIAGTFINVDGATFGSGNPSAQDKLHWTRVIISTFAGGEATGNLQISATNLLVQATTDKEKDLVWMERLRRSYVLQGQADV